MDKYSNKMRKIDAIKLASAKILSSEYEPVTKVGKNRFFNVQKFIGIVPKFTYENAELIKKGYCRFGYDKDTKAWYII